MKSKLFGIDLKDGSKLWAEPQKLDGVFKTQITRETDFIVIHDKGFNMIDYRTGASVWEKERTFKDISKIIETDEGFVIAQENNIDYVGLKGKSIWKKEMEVADKNETVNFMVKADKGILFISPTLCNMLDLNTGKELCKKELKMKKNPLGAYDPIHNKYLAFTSGDLYLIDQDAGEYKLLAENIKFEYGEKPESIEARENGYFLSSPQNAVFVSTDGKIQYQNAYKETKLIRTKSTLLKIVRIASAVGQIAGAGAFLSGEIRLDELNKMADDFYDAEKMANSELSNDAVMAARLKNRKEVQNYKFVLTSLPVDGFEYVSVLQMDKDSGNVLKAITLKDQAPIYEVDEIGKKVYFVYENSIQCFEL